MKKIMCILLSGILAFMTLTVGLAKDEASRTTAANMRDGAVYSTGGVEKETHEQTLEELRIDEWGSVWVGGSENKSTLKKLAESLGVACLPTIGTVISSGTTREAIFLDFLDCEVLFELELLERQYGETPEVARYTGRPAFGEMEFLITTENYLNMQIGYGKITPSYEGVALRF